MHNGMEAMKDWVQSITRSDIKDRKESSIKGGPDDQGNKSYLGLENCLISRKSSLWSWARCSGGDA
jgi:hypothetical protein